MKSSVLPSSETANELQNIEKSLLELVKITHPKKEYMLEYPSDSRHKRVTTTQAMSETASSRLIPDEGRPTRTRPQTPRSPLVPAPPTTPTGGKSHSHPKQKFLCQIKLNRVEWERGLSTRANMQHWQTERAAEEGTGINPHLNFLFSVSFS